MTETQQPGDGKISASAPKAGAQKEYRIRGRALFASTIIAFLVLGCGGWAVTAELAGAVVSQGSVVVARHVKKIQHRDGGIVASINVKDGDHVEAGATLIKLDDTMTRAELGVIQSQLVELRGRQARLLAERDLAERVEFPKAYAKLSGAEEIMAGERRLFASNRAGRESQKNQLRSRIAQAREEIKGVEAQRDAKELELKLFRKELASARSLYARKLTTATRVYGLEREEARIAGEYGNFVAQRARLSGKISETEMQILNVDLTLKTEAQRELRTIEARIAELSEREIAALDRLTRTDIKAPQDGVVHELAVHTVGGVVAPAEAVMMIVPNSEKLSIEVKLPPISIDQVYLGQNVRLRFSAFNQRTTPEKKGRISFISADVSKDPKTQQEYYAAKVELLDTPDWKVAGRPILPGMPVEAYITTDKRTALSYLVKPLTDQFTKAFRER